MASFLQSIIVKESTLCLYLMTLMIDSDSKPFKIVAVNSLVAPEGADAAAQEQAERARALRIGLLESGYNILAALPPALPSIRMLLSPGVSLNWLILLNSWLTWLVMSMFPGCNTAEKFFGSVLIVT